MEQSTVPFRIREAASGVQVIVIDGDVTPASEEALVAAYTDASGARSHVIVLDFSGLDYMNSGGIGLLITLLVRAQRAKQRLLAFGLSDHYRQIFELTRLDDAIAIHDSEADVLASVTG